MSSSADLDPGPALSPVLPQEAQIWYRRDYGDTDEVGSAFLGAQSGQGAAVFLESSLCHQTGPLSPGRSNHRRSAGHWAVQRPPSPSLHCALSHTESISPPSPRTQSFLAWLPWFLPFSRTGRAELGWLRTGHHWPLPHQTLPSRDRSCSWCTLKCTPEPRPPTRRPVSCQGGTMEQITHRC